MPIRIFVWIKKSEEKGAALVIALLVMVVCALLGASAIMTSTTDLQISGFERSFSQAFASADAGVEWLRSQRLDSMYQMDTPRDQTNNEIRSFVEGRGIVFYFDPPSFATPDQNRILREGPKETTSEGQALPVYVAVVCGEDTQRGGRVCIEVELRVPPEGDVGGSISGPRGY